MVLRIIFAVSLAPSVWYCWTIRSTVLVLSAASNWLIGMGLDHRLRWYWKRFRSSDWREFSTLSSSRVTSTVSETRNDTEPVTLASDWFGYSSWINSSFIIKYFLLWHIWAFRVGLSSINSWCCCHVLFVIMCLTGWSVCSGFTFSTEFRHSSCRETSKQTNSLQTIQDKLLLSCIV